MQHLLEAKMIHRLDCYEVFNTRTGARVALFKWCWQAKLVILFNPRWDWSPIVSVNDY